MKKILLLLVLLVSTVLLVACGDPYDVEFRESDKVEMTSAEVSQMLNDITWETPGEAISLNIEADINVTTGTYFEFSDYVYSYENTIDVLFSSNTYFVDSDTVGEVLLHSVSEIEANIDTALNENDIESSETQSYSGSLGVYFTEGFLYVNPNITMNVDGTETSVSGKEKLNEEVTQTMWNEFKNEIDIPETGDMLPAEIPSEILDLLSLENMEALLEAFPAVTVYERSGITNVHIEINKQFISDHMEDLLWFVYDTLDETGEDMPTVEEATADIADMMDEMDDMLAYFDELSFAIDILVAEDMVGRISVELNILSNDSFETEMGTSLDISLSVAANYAAELPNFPEDLDTYTGVDNIGENWGMDFVGSLMPMV